MGETLASSIKRLRLHRAAGQLVNSSATVDEIAQTSGYSRLQSFTRAFSETYGMPPAKFRSEGSHTQFKVKITEGRTTEMMDVNLQQVESFDVLTMSHTGSYMNIGNAFEKLFGWLGVRGLIGPQLRSVGIYYSNPDAVAESELQSDACMPCLR